MSSRTSLILHIIILSLLALWLAYFNLSDPNLNETFTHLMAAVLVFAVMCVWLIIYILWKLKSNK